MPEKFEDEIAEILKSFEGTPQENEATIKTAAEDGQRILHVDKYPLPNGDVLFRLPSGEGILVPKNAVNSLDANAVESHFALTEEELEQFQIHIVAEARKQ